MNTSRRTFVKTAATSMLAMGSLLSRANAAAPGSRIVKVGLVGCGGRSQQDLPNFIEACKILGLEAKVVSLADAFADRVQAAAEKYGVEEKHCHVGWDAYQKVAESDAEFVLLITPPIFRPRHFEAMVDAGKHVMMEKPVAVDGPGCRKVIDVSETAGQKGLGVLAGTQRRHQLNYLINKAKIDAGAIGEILGGSVYWDSRVPWIWERQPGWSDADYLGRNWLNFSEMSADHLGEQHVHNIDVANWFIGRLPTSAVGMGARLRRRTGNNYDSFSLELDYGNGVRIQSTCRQISGTYGRVGEFFRGTKGSVYGGGKLDGVDVDIPEIKVSSEDGSLQEMIDWVSSVRSGNPINEGRMVAEATGVAVMGRLAAYTGQLVRYSDIMLNPNAELYNYTVSLSAEDFEKGTVTLPEEEVAPLPGDGEPLRTRNS